MTHSHLFDSHRGCGRHRAGARSLFVLAIAASGLVPAAAAHAQNCDPYTATVKMQKWPHTMVDLSVHLMVTSPPCDGGTTDLTCMVTIPLDGDDFFSHPEVALAKKCNALKDQLAMNCPRFFHINTGPSDPRPSSPFDCDPTPGQTTQITLTDSVCTGKPTPAGTGLTIAMANALDALDDFNSGDILPDYEQDTILPACLSTAAGMLILRGGGSGTSIFSGTPANVEVQVALGAGPVISHSVPTPAGKTVGTIASELRVGLNNTLIALNRPERCTSAGRILSCEIPQPPAGAAQILAVGDQPMLSATSNDPSVNKVVAAGSRVGIQKMRQAVEQGGCNNLKTDCGVLGKAQAAAAAVPAVNRWGLLVLALAVTGAGSVLIQRRRVRPHV